MYVNVFYLHVTNATASYIQALSLSSYPTSSIVLNSCALKTTPLRYRSGEDACRFFDRFFSNLGQHG